MTADCEVRFCERLRGETAHCLLGGNILRACEQKLHDPLCLLCETLCH